MKEQNRDYDWMLEARTVAAQCWRDDRTKDKEMDIDLAEVIAEKIASYIQLAHRHARNNDTLCSNILMLVKQELDKDIR